MIKKYKHIKIPKGLVSNWLEYIPISRRPPIEELIIDYNIQKPKIQRDVIGLKEKFLIKKQELKIEEDKDFGELKIKFYGMPNNSMLEKYNIEIYERKGKENTIIGSISTKKITGQEKSDFDRLEHDINTYAGTGSLHSYFEKIEEIKPLSIEEILRNDLKKFYEKNPSHKKVVDISFSSSEHNWVENKIDLIHDEYSTNFISKVNTDLVHFCRLSLNFRELETMVNQFNEIIDISSAPIYYYETSWTDIFENSISVISPQPSVKPVFVIDWTCEIEHKTIKWAVIEVNNLSSSDTFHSTAVASLAVCGYSLSPSDDIVQKNSVITIEVDFNKLEESIVDAVYKYKDVYPLLLINLSINDYWNQLYDASQRSNLTILLDELSHKYNCIFFVSVWNLFKLCPPAWEPMAISIWYPEYFKLPFTNILPPADSINNISVWSITYQESPNSIAPMLHPSPITRKNIDNNLFTKPDLVNYDSNLIVSWAKFKSEWNGILLADSISWKDNLTRSCWTSFATPLVTYEAGVLHNLYPEYNNNSIKAILLHFSDWNIWHKIVDTDMRKRLNWFWKTNIEHAMYSINTSSTLILEDSISINTTKRVRIPIPKSLEWSSRKRLRIRKTLVYNPKVFPRDFDNYNPIKLSACVIRPDEKSNSEERELNNRSTKDNHLKSNAKKYPFVEVSTNNNYMWKFWEIEMRCECKNFDMFWIPEDYAQNYSLIVSIDDIKQDDNIDIHKEINQMIEIELGIEVDINI